MDINNPIVKMALASLKNHAKSNGIKAIIVLFDDKGEMEIKTYNEPINVIAKFDETIKYPQTNGK